ncbi:hypothetical protein BCV69DRAFT_285253 [Microstroma glucosiphilum]|uniref:Uncharacterized protein n=1 Tax=Pseudomicrostroma glucosiphilum TaxID=1684307 RepID=A0A316TYD1_9BASI|nr:hypothetical protein BCV69DRAFT_285253 [Pseudomicrostroma glucosiphilum]PWN18286.1 hypothetical protein BCV69DRAFT_285253 [Pseudomicrostroma glucosiphilum]
MSYSPRPPSSNRPSPIGFIIIAAISSAGFYYVANKRDQEAKRAPLSEKRRPFENPLIPPRHRDEELQQQQQQQQYQQQYQKQ